MQSIHIERFPIYVGMVSALSLMYGISYSLGYFFPFGKNTLSFLTVADYINIAISALPISFIVYGIIITLIPVKKLPPLASPEKFSSVEDYSEYAEEHIMANHRSIGRSVKMALKLISTIFFVLILLSFILVPYKFSSDFLPFILVLSFLNFVVFFQLTVENLKVKDIHSLRTGDCFNNVKLILTAALIVNFMCGSFMYGLIGSYLAIGTERTSNIYVSKEMPPATGTFFKLVTSGLFLIEEDELVFYSNSGFKMKVSKVNQDYRTMPCKFFSLCFIDRNFVTKPVIKHESEPYLFQ